RGGTRSRAGVGGSAGFVCRWGDTPVDDERRGAGAAHTCAMCCPGDTECEVAVPPLCILCSLVPARIICLVTTRRMAHSAPGRTTNGQREQGRSAARRVRGIPALST